VAPSSAITKLPASTPFILPLRLRKRANRVPRGGRATRVESLRVGCAKSRSLPGRMCPFMQQAAVTGVAKDACAARRASQVGVPVLRSGMAVALCTNTEATMAHKRQAELTAPAVSTDGDGQLRREIELRAYYRYCDRGCTPGRDRDDWLAAEQEVLATQRATAPSTK